MGRALLGLGLALGVYCNCLAQSQGKDTAAHSPQSPPPLSAATYELLQAARAALKENRPEAARTMLSEFPQASEEPMAYETALVRQALGYALAALERPADAALAFREALASGQLPEEVNHELRHRAGVAFLRAERHAEGAAMLEQWLDAEPRAELELRLALALAYYHLERYDELLPLLEQALREDPPEREDWLSLLLQAYLQKKQHSKALPVLRELLALAPGKRDYWLLLAHLEQALGRATASLAAYELAYQQGVLQAGDLLYLAQGYLERRRPHAAARLLQKESGRLLPRDRATLALQGEAWRQARAPRDAIETWQELLRLEPDDLDTGLRLARLYMEQEQWDKALELLDGLPGGEPPASAERQLLLGISAVRAGRNTSALAALARAAAHDHTRNTACAWLASLEPAATSSHAAACVAPQ